MEKWTVTKCYIDSRFRTFDSISGSDFKFELKEQLGLTDNAVCYVGDIQFPTHGEQLSHIATSFITFKTEYINGSDISYNWVPYFLNIPEGSYSGSNLVTAIQELLHGPGETLFPRLYIQPSKRDCQH